MFFGDLRINLFKMSWLNCKKCAKNQYKKGTRSQLFSVQSVKITFTLFKCDRSIGNSILSCCENAHDYKEFSCENAKPRRES